MRDADIRRSLRQTLVQQFSGEPGTLIIDELGIGQGERRVDLAALNGQLHGYEIKGPRDSLARLAGQAEHYARVFDRMTLVVHPRHEADAIAQIPAWWGVTIVFRAQDADVAFGDGRAPQDNPALEPREIARLLWREEALLVLERYDIDRGVRSKPKRHLYDRLAGALDLPVLRDEVLAALKNRTTWRADAIRT